MTRENGKRAAIYARVSPLSKRLQHVDALLQHEPDAQIHLADALQEEHAPEYDYDTKESGSDPASK